MLMNGARSTNARDEKDMKESMSTKIGDESTRNESTSRRRSKKRRMKRRRKTSR